MSDAIWVVVILFGTSLVGLARQIHAVANYRRMSKLSPAHADGLADVIRATQPRLPFRS